MTSLDAYANSVVSGEIPAGKYHRLACARHLKDIARIGEPDFPYVFDEEKADKFFRFAQKLKHYKGKWAGQPVELQPYQKFRLGSIFGWLHAETGKRRFRNAYHELPRKQGKSLEAAIVTLYVTFFDGEHGAEGYCAATKREQATIVFEDCKKLVLSSGLKQRLKVLVGSIVDERTSSKLQPLSADYNSMDGLNPNMVNIDEYHAHKTRGVVDVLETATGAREQPLVNKITTAGDDPISPCGDEHDYAVKILEGVLTDETYYCFIASADPEDDWTLPYTAQKANPNYGISVNPEDLMAKVVKATGIPSAAATYKQKHLNMWVNATAPCLSVDGWAKGQSDWKWEDMQGQECWVGIDLAAKIDLCSASLVFPPTAERTKWRVIQRIWTPEDTLIDRGRRDRAPYSVWSEQGWLTAVAGTSVNHNLIREDMKELKSMFQIQMIGLDPWHADQIQLDMVANDGWNEAQVLEVPQNFAALTSAESRFKAEVLAGNFDARHCPVTAWAVSNTTEQTDGKGNILFTKKRSRGRIDPVKSITIAMSLYLRQPVEKEPEYTMMIFSGRK